MKSLTLFFFSAFATQALNDFQKQISFLEKGTDALFFLETPNFAQETNSNSIVLPENPAHKEDNSLLQTNTQGTPDGEHLTVTVGLDNSDLTLPLERVTLNVGYTMAFSPSQIYSNRAVLTQTEITDLNPASVQVNSVTGNTESDELGSPKSNGIVINTNEDGSAINYSFLQMNLENGSEVRHDTGQQGVREYVPGFLEGV